MPLVAGRRRADVSKNIRVEVHAGVPQARAVATALSVARRDAPRKNLARAGGFGDVGRLYEIRLNEVKTPELGPWFEAVWRIDGLSRAHRRFEGASYAKAMGAFQKFHREAETKARMKASPKPSAKRRAR